jgi:hypothetical protein
MLEDSRTMLEDSRTLLEDSRTSRDDSRTLLKSFLPSLSELVALAVRIRKKY